MKRLKSVVSLFLVIVLSLSSSINVAAQPQISTTETVTRICEVETLRETNSETYLLSDGSYECVVYAYDKYYEAADKTLRLIDNKFVPAKTAERSGKIAAEKAQYKNAANAFDVHFSDSSIPQISIAYSDASITFSPISAASNHISTQICDFSVGKVTDCPALNELTYTGDNTVTYGNAFHDTDLVYVLEDNMLKEYIILNNANAANSFQFLFSLDGVTLRAMDKYAEFVDENGAALFALGSLFAADSAGAFTDALTYTFAPVKGTNQVAVTVTLDSAYLSAADRAFPVIIDPTIMISSTETADACVCSYTPNTNYQMATQLRTGYEPDYGIRRSYIKFNIPNSIPAHSITNATLDIEKVSGVAPTIKAYLCMSPWSSSSITWSNQPSSATNYIYGSSLSVPFRPGSSWYTMNVTEIVSYWVNGTYTNNGFLIRDNNESDPDHWTTLCSSDADSPHKPELHIEYECESINLQATYDNAYAQRFGSPVNRISNCLNKLKEKYLSEFGIAVNCSSPTIYASYADQNCTATYTTLCPHANSSTCTNSQIFYNGTISYAVLHHTNIYNILARIGAPASSTAAKITYLGRKMCESNGNQCTEVGYVGLALEPIRLVAVMNYESVEKEIASSIHELGHLYGVIDHYGSFNSSYTTEQIDRQYPDRGYDSRCIYGEDKFEDPSVTRDVVICDGCKSWIIENRSKFSG